MRLLLAALVAAAGVGVGAAMAATSGNTVCATTPAHTVAVDGSPVSTTPGDVQCVTAETVTQTVTTTVAAATTTAQATVAPTYASEIAYTQTRPAFTPKRTVNVASASAFRSALTNLLAGDYVKATSAFTVTGETFISNKLTSYAVLDLGSNVTFSYSGGSNLPAVYLNAAYLRIYGGTLTTNSTGGPCVLSHQDDHVLWWGFNCHDAGTDGLDLFPVGGPITNNDFQGTITNVDKHLAWDNHPEKGTGIHGANIDDDGTYAFSGNRVALDINTATDGISFGIVTGKVRATNNTVIERATNLWEKAVSQVGGNCLQTWGAGFQSTDVKYLECSNAQGRAFDANSTVNDLSSNVIEYGRASNTNQNTVMNEPIPYTTVWDPRMNATFQDVAPTP